MTEETQTSPETPAADSTAAPFTDAAMAAPSTAITEDPTVETVVAAPAAAPIDPAFDVNDPVIAAAAVLSPALGDQITSDPANPQIMSTELQEDPGDPTGGDRTAIEMPADGVERTVDLAGTAPNPPAAEAAPIAADPAPVAVVEPVVEPEPLTPIPPAPTEVETVETSAVLPATDPSPVAPAVETIEVTETPEVSVVSPTVAPFSLLSSAEGVMSAEFYACAQRIKALHNEMDDLITRIEVDTAINTEIAAAREHLFNFAASVSRHLGLGG